MFILAFWLLKSNSYALVNAGIKPIENWKTMFAESSPLSHPNTKISHEFFLATIVGFKKWADLLNASEAELFNVGIPAISKHLNNIFDSSELDPNSVVSILETTASDGKNYQSS